MKTCRHCHVSQSLDQFSLDRRNTDAHATICQRCKDARRKPITQEKACTRCHVVQPLTEFDRHPQRFDGHAGICKACRRAHLKARYASEAAFREKHRADQRGKPASPEARARMKQWREQHKEHVQQWFADHYRANRDEKRAYVGAYRRANPDQDKNHSARRRALKLAAAANDLTAAQWREIKAMYDHRCVYCRRKMKAKELTQDHLTPLSKGGSHTASNVVPACLTCNVKKRAAAVLTPVQPVLITLAPSQPVRTRKKSEKNP